MHLICSKYIYGRNQIKMHLCVKCYSPSALARLSLMRNLDINISIASSKVVQDKVTSKILKEWLEDRQGILLTEKLNHPKWESVPSRSRTEAMAQYRNFCLYSLRDKKYDYLFIVDSDIYYDNDLFKSMIHLIDNNQMYGMITPNTQQNISDKFDLSKSTSYYDSWALKDL